MAAANTPQTLQQAIRFYSDIDVCQQMLAEARWPDGVTCPHCGSREVRYLATQRRWECKTKHARRQFSVKVGTIFEDSPIGLDKWFAAIWLIANAKNGISSYEIHRAIGVTQKTAWFMLHRIRLAMQTKSFEKIGGEIEIDETYIGGKARFMHKGKRKVKGSGTAGKVAVMGLLERHGAKGSQVRTEILAGTDRLTVQPEVRRNVEAGAAIFTDQLSAYDGLSRDYIHSVINHAECYAVGNVHTNGLENFWALLKRGIKGTYISVEPFHLFRYLDEQVFRFNNRKTTDAQRFTMTVQAVAGKRLTYAGLTVAAPKPGV